MTTSALTKPNALKPLRWQRSRYSMAARQWDIFGSAARFMFDLWWDTTNSADSPKHRHRRAQWLVGTLLDLGPTFIKIGQALSSRADLLPLEYVQALSRLQDQVPEFNADEAIALIESELGSSIHTLFRDFDRHPIAAASLGQVHRARLHTGEDVVIKVQRPGLQALFDLDLKVLRRLMHICERVFPWAQQYELEEIYNEFFSILYKEIDYVQEGKNADRFRQNFIDHPRIHVPVIHWRYTSTKVLTMEYVPGVKISDRQTMAACGLNVKEITQLGICCYLKQLLQDGFFQADPHPGNMAVTQDGNLIFYDFGMMAEVKSLDRDQMVKTFFAVMKKDTDQVIGTLTDMGLIEPVADMAPVRRVLRFVLDNFVEKPLDVQAFGRVKHELYLLFEQQPFRLPAKMTYILKSLTTLDGIARTLDPEYSLMTAAKPFVKSLTVLKSGNTLGELARQARDFVKFKIQQPSAVERVLQRLEERLEQGELQVRVKSLESDRALKRIQLAIKSLIYACLSGFTLLSGVVLVVAANYSGWAIAAFTLAGLGFLQLLRSLLDLSIREKLDRLAEK